MSERRSGKRGQSLWLTIATLAGALTVGGAALAQQHSHHGGGPVPRGGGPPGWAGGGGPPGWARGGGPPGWARSAGPPGWDRSASLPPRGMSPYDPRQHNGYWLGNRWYYGPPPGPVIRQPGFRPGFAPFRPGAFLPPAYEGVNIDDYARFHLRRPPYGYRWVQAGGDYLLVSMSTGQIFDVVPGF